MLILSRKPGESIFINREIKVTIINIQGQRVKVGFEASENVEIHREEVLQKIKVKEYNQIGAICNDMDRIPGVEESEEEGY